MSVPPGPVSSVLSLTSTNFASLVFFHEADDLHLQSSLFFLSLEKCAALTWSHAQITDKTENSWHIHCVFLTVFRSRFETKQQWHSSWTLFQDCRPLMQRSARIIQQHPPRLLGFHSVRGDWWWQVVATKQQSNKRLYRQIANQKLFFFLTMEKKQTNPEALHSCCFPKVHFTECTILNKPEIKKSM